MHLLFTDTPAWVTFCLPPAVANESVTLFDTGDAEVMRGSHILRDTGDAELMRGSHILRPKGGVL